MQVIFHSIEAANFRSFHRLKVSFQRKGTTLVQGVLKGDLETIESNGAGKSAIFSAIAWALYGKFPHISGKDVTGDDVIKWGTTDCFAEIKFLINDRFYIIKRYRQHPHFKNKVTLCENDWQNEKTLSSNNLTQQLIDEILGISFDLFCQLVFITESSMKSSFSYETDAKRKQMLVDVLPQLKQFSIARGKVKEFHDSFVSADSKFDHELDSLRSTLETLPDTEDSRVQITDSFSRIRKLEERRQKNYGLIESIDLELESVLETSKSLNEAIVRSRFRVKELQQAETYNASLYAVSNARIASVEILLIKWKDLGDECPECEQPIDTIVKDTRITSLEEQLQLLQEKHKAITDILELSKKEVNNVEAEFQELERKSVWAKDTANNLEKERARIVADNATIEIELQGLKSFIENVQETCDRIDQTKTRIETKINESLVIQEIVKSYLDPLKFWLNGFGPRGVVAFALTQTLDLLTIKTNAWLHKLWHEGINVAFGFPSDDVSKITASLMFNKREINLITLSSGQTRRLCLAICFGLRETLQLLSGWQTNLLVLDEVFDGLDNAGRYQVLHIIRDMQDTSIFVITQFPHFNGPIDHTINVVHEQGNSIIEQETQDAG